MTLRQLPIALEAEQAVLSGLLLDPGRVEAVRDVICAADFYRPAGRIIFDAICSVVVGGGALDLVTLKARLSARGELDAVGGDVALAELADYAATTANIDTHAQLVKEAANRRRAISELERATDAISDPSIPLADAVAKAQEQLALIPCAAPRSSAETIRLSDVKPERVEWLWPGRIALGKLCAVVGDAGLGKSTLTLDLAARITTGQVMPDGMPGIDGGVVILSAEDGLADTVCPRLEAARADLTRVCALTRARNSGGRFRSVSLDDLDAIREAIASVSARLLVIDPLMAFLPGRSDSHRDQDVRSVLAPLARLADEMRCAVLIVAHNNKSRGVKALHRAGGSVGIIAATRSAFVVAADPEDPERRVLATIKSNLARPAVSLAYHLAEVESLVARIAWDGESAHSADTLLAASDASVESSGDVGALGEARDFLRDALHSGPKSARTIQAEARNTAITTATLRRARVAERVVVTKAAYAGGWVWALPAVEGAQASPEGAQAPGMSTFAPSMSAFPREEF